MRTKVRNDNKEITITVNRVELNWLYRQMSSGRDRAAALVEQYKGPQADGKADQIANAQARHHELSQVVQALKDLLDEGVRSRANIVFMKEELMEAIDLVEDDVDALAAISRKLEDLPREEDYRLTFDRDTVKVIIELIEKDLQNFRSHIIPTYEKANQEDFKDPIQTKAYFINKARKAKDTLDNLKHRMEKQL